MISIQQSPILKKTIIQSNNKTSNKTSPQVCNHSVTLNNKTQNKIHQNIDNSKFCTSILPKETNIQIETILYEL